MKTEIKSFKKIVRPGTVDVGYPVRAVDVFCKIEYSEDGRLSISGVEGPRANGDAWGGCGQIVMSLKAEDITPAPGWDRFSIGAFLTLWDRWHLNDMSPCCEHQRAAGWYDKAGQKVKLYHWRLDDAAQKEKDAAEKAAQAALLAGEVFAPTTRQHKAANREYEVTTHTPDAPAHYTPRTSLYASMAGPVEEKGLGWLYEKEHPEGLLCRPCPECGYKYGSEWKREEVPASVLETFRALPGTDKTPAWV